ncbi:KilA-N domain-containing protein [Shewanella sp. AS1]|uniref:KilA-N domain-containing protein n=1 Tax=Shewanella sp. AS1 TaxID=2907626 RepID=UPI001F2B628D|nr:KilA-N domain-containing protein [Shewanella sp. AS1]MCE9679595.1 KilA-N domain-containing protein [Shewanella sp. AS1]
MTNHITVANQPITLDQHDRINLNELHRASGLGSAKKPSNWLRLASTAELVDELSNCSDLSSLSVCKTEGRNGGTFAHQLLAISYAGWISPRFQLQVNQAFLDSRRQPKALALPANQMAIDKDRYIALLEQSLDLLQQQKPKKAANVPLSVDEKQHIIRAHQQGMSNAHIAAQLGRSRSAVRALVREYQAASGRDA